MVNSNWWCFLEDAADLDKKMFARPPPKGVLTGQQITRASRLVNYFVDVKLMIDKLGISPFIISL